MSNNINSLALLFSNKEETYNIDDLIVPYQEIYPIQASRIIDIEHVGGALIIYSEEPNGYITTKCYPIEDNNLLLGRALDIQRELKSAQKYIDFDSCEDTLH